MHELFSKIHTTLPLFAIPYNKDFIIYTPGYFTVLNNITPNEINVFFAKPQTCNNTDTKQVIENLLKTAQNNLDKWKANQNKDFKPECLTIHVGNECNLNCSYCYSKLQASTPKGFPDLNMVESSLNYMLPNLPSASSTLNIVYHGSGEPTYHWEKLLETNSLINKFAKQHKLKVFTYIASNGIIAKHKAAWLARNINLIGLSCDGPDIIQQLQRKSKTNIEHSLKQTCKTISELGGKFNIRTTITQQSISKQKQIVAYLIEELNAQKIRIEPFYLAENGFKPDQAQAFFAHFKEAQNYAAKHQVELSYSGLRMEEIHSTFCDQYRNNLRLTPDGTINNCFCKFSDNENFALGKVTDDRLELNRNSIKANLPIECEECINMLHCSRGCPDFCRFDSGSGLNQFKCKLHKIMAVNNITELAKHAIQ
ncbi:MAG: hypothetical protein PF517_21910 [Salinivirgaceae bacterium]|jgi:radical SAM protein with 4Fe4S-binding SPASM domain|nr:hypothetical protein [Salinivirgaceae bacterium]